jgi:hypothetical protein
MDQPSSLKRPSLTPSSPFHAMSADEMQARLYVDVADRLRGVCADMPQDELHALVVDMVAMKMRWGGRLAG